MSNRDQDNQKRRENAVRARQGFLGIPVLYVLLAGLFLAVLVIIAVVIWANTEEEPPLDPPSVDDGLTPENRL